MSAVVVKACELCDRCILLAHPFRPGAEERCEALRLFIDMNDFCDKCLEASHRIVIRAPYPSERKIAEYVERKSPWVRRERWRHRMYRIRLHFSQYRTQPQLIILDGMLLTCLLTIAFVLIMFGKRAGAW